MSTKNAKKAKNVQKKQQQQQQQKSARKEKEPEEEKTLDMLCIYCHKPFEDPKVLCCSRLCKDCLQKYIIDTVKDDFIDCLVCGDQIKIPDPYRPREEWANQYRTDVFLQRMLNAADQVNKPHNCFVCESNRNEATSATQYCFNCDTYYCSKCNELHLQLRGLQGHSIVSIGDVKPKDLMTKRNLYCTSHSDKCLDTYCSNETGVVVCSQCARDNHKNCTTIPVPQAAKDWEEKLAKVREKIPAVIELQEQNKEVLRERCSRLGKHTSQKVSEIEGAFSRIQTSLDKRKAELLQHVQETSDKNGSGLTSMADKTTSYLGAMRDVRTYLTWMNLCGAEYDVVSSADIAVTQYDRLYDLSREPSVNDTSAYKDTFHIEESIVSTFIQLVNMIGTESEGHIIAFKTKQINLRMPEDVHEPVIKDVLLLEDGQLLATDNKNKCIKMTGLSALGDTRTVRLDLRTEPWGVAKLQVNVIAVTGHECLYIVTKTEELHLQSTVRTRKDYWAVAALSPINLALTCKFPPCVDIVDITGRKLRTIETDGNGSPYFSIPQYLAVLYDKLLVTDRDKKELRCMDSYGAAMFQIDATPIAPLAHPKGVVASSTGRIFLVENEDVWLVSSTGKMLNKIVSNTPGITAITEENGTLCLSVEGRGVVFYKIIDMSMV